MANGGDKIRFALDHNFPAPVLAAFAVMMPGVELVPIMQIDPKLAELDDWELFLALHRHEESWDGLVTNDDKLLALPKEMTVLSQTNLTLVVAVGEGHNPVRAVGVLLCHLGHICHHSRRDRAQVWKLEVKQKNYEEPNKYLTTIAEKQKTTVERLVQTHKLTAKELRRE
jgi:hypothetical protein